MPAHWLVVRAWVALALALGTVSELVILMDVVACGNRQMMAVTGWV